MPTSVPRTTNPPATVPPSGGNINLTPVPTTPGGATVWNVALTAARPVTRLIAMQNTHYVTPSPYYVSAADEYAWAINYEGCTLCSSPSAKAYKNGTDVTATILPTGSASAAGNVVTLPTAKAWTSGQRYVIETVATVDGVIITKVLVVIVRRTGGE